MRSRLLLPGQTCLGAGEGESDTSHVSRVWARVMLRLVVPDQNHPDPPEADDLGSLQFMLKLAKYFSDEGIN